MLDGYYLKVDECNLKAWRKANEGDLTYLRIDRKKGTEKRDKEAWSELSDDFIVQVGLSDEFKEYLELLYERCELQLAYLKSEKIVDDIVIRDRKLKNRIKLLDGQIKAFNLTQGKKLTITQILSRLSKMQGYHIRETEIMVLEYHNLLKDYSDGKTN